MKNRTPKIISDLDIPKKPINLSRLKIWKFNFKDIDCYDMDTLLYRLYNILRTSTTPYDDCINILKRFDKKSINRILIHFEREYKREITEAQVFRLNTYLRILKLI